MICFWWQRLVDGVRVSLLGGVGRGGAGALTFKYTGTPTWCYARDVFTYTCTSTWCNAGDVFTCTCTATWCYARDVFACTCTSTWCYAATLSWHNTQRILCQVKHTQSQFTSKIRKIMRWNTKEPFFSWYDNAEAWWHIYILYYIRLVLETNVKRTFVEVSWVTLFQLQALKRDPRAALTKISA